MALLPDQLKPAPASTFPSERVDLAGVTRVGPWVLGRTIDQGGFSDVRDTHRRGSFWPYVFKGYDGRYSTELFDREVAIHGSLDHPNVITLRDSGTGTPEGAGASDLLQVKYIVMDKARGGSLRRRVNQRGPLSPEAAAKATGQAASALDAVHGLGLVHRDVKPGNLLLGERGKVLLTDFGITVEDPHDITGDPILGTYEYCAPEQFDGPVRKPTDIYGLGLTTVFMLTGEPLWNLSPVDHATTAKDPGTHDGFIKTRLEAMVPPRLHLPLQSALQHDWQLRPESPLIFADSLGANARESETPRGRRHFLAHNKN